MFNQMLLREEAFAVLWTTKLRAQEEVLHIDDDESGLRWVYRDSCGCGSDAETGCDRVRCRLGRMRQVKACGAII